jgi:hypothetical protein
MSSRKLKLKDVTKCCRALWRNADLAKVDPAPTSSSPGTAPPPACACPTPTGSPPTAKGLTICDATSAAFAQELDWAKLDVVTFSWQKALGGEAAHGMLMLSPARGGAAGELHAGLAAAEDLPHDQGRQAQRGIFEGETINTPSMLCVEDYLDALQWAKSIGGLKALIGARRRQCQGARRLGGADAVDRFPGQGSGDALQHLGVPEGGRSRGHALPPTRRRISPRSWPRCSRRKASPTTSRIIATRRRACASGAAPRSRRATSKR